MMHRTNYFDVAQNQWNRFFVSFQTSCNSDLLGIVLCVWLWHSFDKFLSQWYQKRFNMWRKFKTLIALLLSQITIKRGMYIPTSMKLFTLYHNEKSSLSLATIKMLCGVWWQLMIIRDLFLSIDPSSLFLYECTYREDDVIRVVEISLSASLSILFFFLTI